MSHKKQQRTRIEDLSADGNELFELSEEMMMMVGGGYGSVENPLGGTLNFKPYETYFGPSDVRTDYEVEWD